MKMLPVAIAGLIVSLSFQCGAEAQFRYGRFGGVNINIPLGGFGYGGFGPRHPGYGYGGFGYNRFGYSGLGHPGFGPHVGIPIYPVDNYRVPVYRVPAYRVPIYSVRVEPRRHYTVPRRTYVYPRSVHPEPAIHRYAPNVAGDNARSDNAGSAEGYADDFSGNNVINENSLLQSAAVLRQSLSRRKIDADVWLEYLDPDLIIDTVQSGDDGSDLQDLLRNYDGLSGNADLSELWIIPGFRRTHQGLRAYVKNSENRVQVNPQAPLNVDSVPAPLADPQTDSGRDLLLDLEQELPAPI